MRKENVKIISLKPVDLKCPFRTQIESYTIVDPSLEESSKGNLQLQLRQI